MANMIVGTSGNDTLVGGDGSDYLDGGAGDDSLSGGNGWDFLKGGAGNDTLDGGANISIYEFDVAVYDDATSAVQVNLALGTGTGGGVGVDTLIGMEGVIGSAFNDSIIGGATDDWLSGEAGSDTIDGGAGNNDFANYGGGSTTAGVNVSLLTGVVSGGAGNDVLSNIEHVWGSSYNDTVVGSAANNFIVGGTGDDTIDGGAGTDRVGYQSASGGVTVSLMTNTSSGPDGNDTLISIENLRGSNFGDTLTGNAGANDFQARGGDDTVYGGDGNDNLQGEDGNDSLLGQAGNDTLIGGAGNDTMDGGVVLDHINYSDNNFTSYASATAGVNINLSGITGDGSVGSGTATGDASVGTDTLINIDFLLGSNFNDTIVGSSALIFEQIEGGAGNDSLDGGAITDTLNADNSNRVSYQNASGAGVTVDLIAGTAVGAVGSNVGSDTLHNFNQLRGSNFADTLLGSNRTDVTEHFEGRDGNDLIDGRGGFDVVRYGNSTAGVTVNLVTGTATGAGVGTDTLQNIEGVIGSNFNDVLTGGNAANGIMVSDGLIEVFRGEAGSDTIDGGQGYDRVDYTSSTAAVVVTLNDTLDGSASDGLSGTDVLRNIEGVRGSAFNDTLTGSNTAAFESFEGREGSDIIDGMGGIDRVDYQYSRAGVTVDLATNTASDGYGGTDTLLNIENVRGSRDFNDNITGSSENNKLEGLGGDDTLIGGAGNDTLQGGAGNDTLTGGEGTDTFVFDMSLSNGTDRITDLVRNETISVAGLALTSVAANNGGTLTTGQVAVDTTVANVTTVRIGTDDIAGADITIELTGSFKVTDFAVVAQDGVNVLRVVNTPASGSVTMIGGPGNDIYLVDNAKDVIVEDNKGGTDTVYFKGSSYTLPKNVENLVVLSSGDANITGNAQDNVIRGGAGNDMLKGGAGSDTLFGGAGNDTLDGGKGDNTLDGGGGVDVAVYHDDRSDYRVWTDASGVTHVKGDGVDLLREMNVLRFDDGDINLVAAPHQVNTSTTQINFAPKVATLADGGYVIVWFTDVWSNSDHATSGVSQILAQRFDANGSAKGAPIVVVSGAEGVTRDVVVGDVTGTRDGGFTVSYSHLDIALADSPSDICVQHYDSAGAVAGSAVRANGTTNGNQDAPATTQLENGALVAVWTSNQESNGTNGIYGTLIAPDGTVVGTSDAHINTLNELGSQQRPLVAALHTVDGTGGYVVAWEGPPASSGGGREIWIQRYDQGGIALGANAVVNTTTANLQKAVGISGLTDGGFVVTWASDLDGSNTHYAVIGQRFNANGTTNGGELTIGDHLGFVGLQHVNVVGTADGGFTAVWTNDATAQAAVDDGNGGVVMNQVTTGQIMGRHYQADGTAWDAFQISSTTPYGAYEVTGLAETSDGRFVVSWYADDNKIYQQIVDNAGHAELVMAPVAETTQQRFIMPMGVQELSYVGANTAYLQYGPPYSTGFDVDAPGTAAADKWNLHFAQDNPSDFIEAYLSGNSGNNKITGGAGSDVLDGRGGTDTLIGGPGNDIYLVDNAKDVIVEDSKGGTDTVYFKGSSYTLPKNVENLVVISSSDANITGNAQDNVIRGGAGNDILKGGAGSDTFVFDSTSGNDRILDFGVAQGDRIAIVAGTHGFTSPESALAFIHDVGGTAVIDLGDGNSLTLVGVHTSALHLVNIVIL